MAFKDAAKNIVGKRISSVVMKQGNRPQAQLFLIFDDGTYFEFYSDGGIYGAGGIDRGGLDEVRQYCGTSHRIVLEASAEDEAEGSHP